MQIEYARQFLKAASRLPAKLITRAGEKEVLFRGNPFHPSLDTHKLHGKDKGAWTFSVDRRFRIKFIFLSFDHVLFIDIGTHDIYT